MAWVTFIVSLAGLLGGGVVLSGTLVREAVKRFGCPDAVADATFRHFVGVGLSVSVVAWLGFTALCLSRMQPAWRASGSAIFSAFFWPTRRVVILSGRVTPGWLSWLWCSLVNGVILYVLITLARRFVVRSRKPAV